MSKIQPVRTLKEAKYSFDHVRNAWFCGRKSVSEEAVLIFLIQYAKSQNIRNAGEWAESALESAKSDPEITTSAFMKAHMVQKLARESSEIQEINENGAKRAILSDKVSGAATSLLLFGMY